MQKKRIIWADDEIELLKPHILFLEQRGYEVTPVTNGEDAISQVRTRKYDLVLLDEMMDGKDGLTTLEEIKENSPTIPVVMITKSEEERLMEDAIGRKIDFYLTKPVNPSQILMACKQIFESRKLTEQKISRDYVQEFNRISQKLMDRLEFKDWYDIAQSMAEWEVELDALTDTGLRQMLEDQRKACNVEFGKFVEKNYHGWVNSGLPQRPEFSVDIVRNYVFPKIAARRKVVFIVIDCLRIDQWLGFESVLQEYFNINKKFYYSILPTST
ncbi:MAG TPA: response regulator, partial [bacterium]|nr:response regulator [bacterium]